MTMFSMVCTVLKLMESWSCRWCTEIYDGSMWRENREDVVEALGMFIHW